MICYRLRNIRKGRRFSLWAKGKYRLRYLKGEITTAPKGTLGIFCFKERPKAELSKSKSFDALEVYRVEAIGEARSPNYVSAYIDEKGLNQFYQKNLSQGVATIFDIDLVCYDQVKVLE